jgi:hypothetical protein
MNSASKAMAVDQATIDKHLDTVLRASGSALRHYSMQKTLDDMRAAMRAAMGSTTAVGAGELDAARLDFLDTNLHQFRMGWQISTAPIGNLSVRCIIMGGEPIREAIDKARTAATSAGVQGDAA